MKTTLFLIGLLLLGALATAPMGQAALPRVDGLDCSQVYSRTDVDTYSVVRRNSCAAPEVYQCPHEGAPISQCHGLVGASTASSLVAIPWPGGQTPDVQCMDVYSETHLAGQYWLVRRNSCSAQLYECPDGYNPPAPPCEEAQILSTSSPSTASCYMVYTRTNVGTYSVVRRTSCSPPEVYQCPYEGAPIDRCQSLLNSLLSSSAAVPAYEPQCMYVYRETQVGPVMQVSRDSCHSETYVCEDDDGVHEADETLAAFVGRQVANPSTAESQSCVEEFLGDYVAFG